MTPRELINRLSERLDYGGLPVYLCFVADGIEWDCKLDGVAFVTNTKNGDESTTKPSYVVLMGPGV